MAPKTLLTLLASIALLTAASCSGSQAKDTSSDTPREEATASTQAQDKAKSQPAESQPNLATPKEAWVEQRVAESQTRLADDGEAGQLIAEAIAYHGGLKTWWLNGPLGFRFTYEPVDGEGVRNTYQIVDTWRARARHEMVDEPEKMFGWTGEQAWVNHAEPSVNPRFWALTPYYFIGIPFVLADEGVNLEMDGQQEFEGTTYDLVRATFDDDTGDAPDDFYVIYLHPETRRVAGVRYVVSYPGFFPDGGTSPEKFMAYEGTQTVEGITFPATFRTFTWKPEQQTHGELVTEIEMAEVEFKPDTKDAFFEPPEGATLLKGF